MMKERYSGGIAFDMFWKKRTAEDRQTRRSATTATVAAPRCLSSTELEVGSTPAERRIRVKTALGTMEDVAVKSAAATKEVIEISKAFVHKHTADPTESVIRNPELQQQNQGRLQPADPTQPGAKLAKKVAKRLATAAKRDAKKQKNKFTGI
jgi:hypothetical protein